MARPLRLILGVSAAALCLAAAGFWVLTMPRSIGPADLPQFAASAERGRTIFAIGGCASCHAAEGAKDDDRRVLAGGRRFVTEFGTFVAPNISPDPQSGIGGWTEADFATAMLHGVSPEGEHYYPAFPYGSYARMRLEDVRDLWAYLMTLPPSARPDEPHEIGFPFSIRRGIGLWKLRYVDPAPVADVPDDVARGQYLVEGPGHCGECHTPRDPFGGPDPTRWLAGAPNPDGKGRIPDITPAGEDVAGWSVEDIAYYLESGFTPDYDSAGGSMVEVIENTAALTPEDRLAIASYLKAIPASVP